jgi:GntP family gluconate:H+ symporter
MADRSARPALNDLNSVLFNQTVPLPIFAVLSQSQLLICTLFIVVGLIWLITRWRVPAFIALLLASFGIGACASLSVTQISKAFQDGVGAVLGSIAMIVGLGTILGKLLAESGGAEQIAQRLLGLFGERRLSWTMLLLGFVVGIPVFFGVGLVLLAPILFAVYQKSNTPFLYLAIPLVAGLSAAHGLVPPHPGPMVAIEMLKADVGKTVFYSLIIGSVAAILSGPLLCYFSKSWTIVKSTAPQIQNPATPTDRDLPPFGATLLTVLLPVILMMLATAADLLFTFDDPIRKVADGLGTPLCALVIAVFVASRVLGTKRGYDRNAILKFCEESMGPIASILLVVGAGGGFNKVLVTSGVGGAIADFAKHAPVSPLVFGWLIAAVIRVATGSATVAIATAAGIVAPLAATLPNLHREMLVIAMGAGSLVLSHVNDGGFWFVKEYLGLTVSETLKSWTVMETVLSITTLGLTLAMDKLLR